MDDLFDPLVEYRVLLRDAIIEIGEAEEMFDALKSSGSHAEMEAARTNIREWFFDWAVEWAASADRRILKEVNAYGEQKK